MLLVPKLFTELGKRAFLHAAPSVWNLLQLILILQKLVSFCEFKSLLQKLNALSFGCYMGEY